MRIGIDIMGGDFSPITTIRGSILAKKNLPKDVEIIFYGVKENITSLLEEYNTPINTFKIIDCPEVIKMDEHPIKGLKQKPKSSISIGIKHLSENKIDGFASAGNTGAMFVSGFHHIKPISGIIRPCISSILPKEDGKVGILLDVGANADCKADVLYQFGVLGSLFAEYVFNIKNPRVGLLNLGEEESKGNLLTQSTYEIMKNNNEYNFIGNIEGTELFESKADVIVCDGFTGNIVLKQAEAFYKLIKKRNIKDDYFERFNYEIYGGTPILGVNKTVVIGHGISNDIAIKNMIILTKNTIEARLSDKIKETLIK